MLCFCYQLLYLPCFYQDSSASSIATQVACSKAKADDCLPAGLGDSKRKQKTGAERRAIRAAKRAREEDGGYTDKGRMAFKKEGGTLVTGNERSCVPDALFLLLSLSISVSVETVRAIMPDGPDQNTKFSVADKFVKQFGLTLKRVTGTFNYGVKGGTALSLLRTKGLFIVQLRIAYNKDDKAPDLHCIAYDGSTLRDNYQRAKVKELDSTDRSCSENARKVFDSFSPGLEVRIKNVYELAPTHETLNGAASA